MIRDLARLANEAFDVLVIGGGIYGLATLRELVARGLTAALIDRGDFAAATSFNSLKTIHGGIRALQHGALPAMRQFVRERRGLAAIAPHLVRPLPFVVPTYRHLLRSRPVMAAFLAAYDLLAADRNENLEPRLALPRSRTISRDECLLLNPVVDPAGVTGGAVWHDYQLHSPERLAIGLLAGAAKRGAAAANYIEAQQFVRSGRDIRAVRARDAVGGTELDVRCRLVVNAAGPWAWPLLQGAGVAPKSVPQPAMSIAMNLVVNRPPASHAAGGLVDGRFLFLVPWRDRSIVGTSHDEFGAAPDELAVTERRLASFLRDTSEAFPRAGITSADVTLVHRGLLPASRGAELLKESVIHDHASDGIDGLVTVLGVRYTTARATAAAAAELVASKLGKPAGSRTPTLEPVPEPDRAAIDDLVRRNPSLAAPLSESCAVTRARIALATRDEMAIHLADALLRRTDAGTGGHPGAEAVRSAAAVMAGELGWTASRTADEIAAVEALYPGSGALPGVRP
jgi:glycerol-3-phosphate dehydrogenase